MAERTRLDNKNNEKIDKVTQRAVEAAEKITGVVVGEMPNYPGRIFKTKK